MCGIAGYCNFNEVLSNDSEKNNKIVEQMGKTLTHRGPNDFGTYISTHVAFSHARLAVIDPAGGAQPMVRMGNDNEYCIIYNGELYNTADIKNELLKKGYTFESTSDTEVLLLSYIEYGPSCVDHLNGIFSFAIWDSGKQCCFLCRDRFGVKPLFYTYYESTFLFASELKALFQYPGIKPIIDKDGICEIFGLGPARSPGVGVFQNIHEIMPGYAALITKDNTNIYPYWTFIAKEHTDSYSQTVEKTRYLLIDSIKRQLVSDVPLCTLLSGGLDSSIVSSVAASHLKENGLGLDTYSFDYLNNSQYFKASSFQPSQDRPFVDIMVETLDTNHTYLQCDSSSLFTSLFDAVLAKDLPGMADVDSSLLYFSKGVKKNHTVCLSGECADEVFGGYPWFRDQAAYDTNAFPWSKNLDFRKEILNPSLLKKLPLEEYVHNRYEETLKRMPRLSGESKLCTRQREISYLNTSWFMTTLLDRKDRMTMANGLEVRVPFADHRLVEYLYNVPWEYKYHKEEVKGLLKDAAEGLLPEQVLRRKKCPYPKTYDPAYEALLKQHLSTILTNKHAPIHNLINQPVLETMMNSTSDYGRPWFGQLMATPQMYAYLIQINFWLEHYQIELFL